MDTNHIYVEQCPLIFPRLCCSLLDNGISFKTKGKMGGDYQLNRQVIKYLFNSQSLDTVPDILYYRKDSGQWIEVFTNQCILDCGKQGKYEYYRELSSLAKSSLTLEVLLDYLRLNSAANIQTLNVTVEEMFDTKAPV